MNHRKSRPFHVASNFFDTINVPLAMGRAFLPEEEEAGKEQEIILGHALWEQRYASDPSILGKNIKVDGKSFTVVGVTKKGFVYPMPAEAWLPLYFTTKDRGRRRQSAGSFLVGRLAPRVFIPTKPSAEMLGMSQQQADAYPDTNRGFRIAPPLLRNYMTSQSHPSKYMILLLGAPSGFVLHSRLRQRRQRSVCTRDRTRR